MSRHSPSSERQPPEGGLLDAFGEAVNGTDRWRADQDRRRRAQERAETVRAGRDIAGLVFAWAFVVVVIALMVIGLVAFARRAL